MFSRAIKKMPTKATHASVIGKWVASRIHSPKIHVKATRAKTTIANTRFSVQGMYSSNLRRSNLKLSFGRNKANNTSTMTGNNSTVKGIPIRNQSLNE